jgi:hypothetical protein
LRLLAGRWALPGAGSCRDTAYDRRLDNDIRSFPDQQQMLDIVAADENKPVTVIDRQAVDNSQPGDAVAAAAGQCRSVKPAEQPIADAGQDQDENEDYEELGYDSSALAEYRFQHFTSPGCPERTVVCGGPL